MFEVINWPADMAPSRSPIHFTNELEVGVSPATIWSLLTGPLARLWKRQTAGIIPEEIS